MHSAIFVAIEISQRSDWLKLLEFAESKIQKDKSVVRLAQNVWLLNLQESVAPLGWLVAFAEQYGVPHGILPFEHAPEWLPGGFDPASTQDQNERS